jgi:Ankyrin repeat
LANFLSGNTQCVRLAVELGGMDVNIFGQRPKKIKGEGEKKEIKGHSPLHVAVFHNQPSTVHELLRLGADAFAEVHGTTALQLAVKRKQVDVVRCVRVRVRACCLFVTYVFHTSSIYLLILFSFKGILQIHYTTRKHGKQRGTSRC